MTQASTNVMSRALIGLGANLGEPAHQLEQALAELDALADVHVERVSRFLVTRPVGGPVDQANYLNAAAVLQCSCTPLALWEAMSRVEQQLGRRRIERWGARSIDLDLLLFADVILDTPRLTIPHPRLAVRRFVLEPAAEVAAEMIHPRIGWSIGKLFDHLVSALPILYVFGSLPETRDKLCAALREFAGSWTIESRAASQLVAATFTVPPKLLVLLNEPTEEGAALRQQIETLHRGPYLIVDARDWPSMWDEVTAAVAAMT